MSFSRERLAKGESLILPQGLNSVVMGVQRVTYEALVPGCSLVAEDVVSSTEHHHVREVVAKAQEPTMSRTESPRTPHPAVSITDI